VKATLGWWMYEWGSHDARFGVTIVAGCAALGAIGTVLTGAAPGGLLGFFVVLGTVTACLAVRPRASYLIIPSPALAYLVAAMLAGVVDDHAGGAAKTIYAIGALQWIASGFVAMVIATVCAIGIAGTRWWLAIRRGS
jgi:hypothetical protein